MCTGRASKQIYIILHCLLNQDKGLEEILSYCTQQESQWSLFWLLLFRVFFNFWIRSVVQSIKWRCTVNIYRIPTTFLYLSFYCLILWVKLRCWHCIACLLQATNKRAEVLFIPAILTSILVGLITDQWSALNPGVNTPETLSGRIWSLRNTKAWFRLKD